MVDAHVSVDHTEVADHGLTSRQCGVWIAITPLSDTTMSATAHASDNIFLSGDDVVLLPEVLEACEDQRPTFITLCGDVTADVKKTAAKLNRLQTSVSKNSFIF